LIYDFPGVEAPIRQGDIFTGMPRVDLSLKNFVVIDGEGNALPAKWPDIAKIGKPVVIPVPVRPVTAIVATQDCDAIRAPEIVLCEVQPFEQVEGKLKTITNTRKIVDLITQHSRINQKWFYLPPSEKLGLGSKMAVDFRLTLRVHREDLEDLKPSRVGRLNDLAEAHFRERIGEFFRRYPYDEWYALTPEETDAYAKDRENVTRYPWQKS
jgi:hypothetical protein